MSKKIYDVLPPKVAHKLKDAKKDLSDKDKEKKVKVRHLAVPEHKKIHPVKSARGGGSPLANQFNWVNTKKKVKGFPVKEILVGVLVIFFLFSIYLYNKLPRVEVQIWPKLENLTFQEKIMANKTVFNIDLFQKIIPANYVESLEEDSLIFEATGSSSNDSKASGSIVIYNKMNPGTPLTLIKGTHFLSDSGKYFVTLEKVIIPGAKGKTPGSITVKVQAKEVGEDYNIGPSNFSVPKLSGTVYYYNIWAESKDKMSNGYTGIVKKVTKDDISRSKDILTEKLLNKAENSLKNQISPDDILLEEAILREVISVSSDAKVDSITDKFNQLAKVKVSALVFKRSDLEKLTKDYILSKISDSKNFLEESLDINYDSELVDMEKGTETLNLQISVKTYDKIDIKELVDLSSRKSEEDIKDVAERMYGDKIAGMKVNFWPFWVNKAPANKDRIKIDLNFD